MLTFLSGALARDFALMEDPGQHSTMPLALRTNWWLPVGRGPGRQAEWVKGVGDTGFQLWNEHIIEMKGTV